MERFGTILQAEERNLLVEEMKGYMIMLSSLVPMYPLLGCFGL